MKNGCTGLIKITRTPAGEAPLWVRHAWLGLVLPCGPYVGFSEGKSRSVISLKEVPNRYGFSVPQKKAIEILRRVRPNAARWWLVEGYPHRGKYFCFAEDEAKIISGVTRQIIRQVSAEMMGDPNR